nr:nuclear factor 7, ovary-like [Procambarus clarkii]
MEEVVFCQMCSQLYQKGARDPLLLPCGHDFCRGCVTASTQRDNIRCPTCKKRHKLFHTEDMPVVHKVLKLSLDFKQKLYGVCSEHGDQLKSSWCSECNVAVCPSCANIQLHNGHEIQLTEDYIKHKKAELSQNITETDNKLKITRYLNGRILDYIAQYEHQQYIISIEKIQQLKKAIAKAYRIDCLTNFEIELNNMKDLLHTEVELNQFIHFRNEASEKVKESEKDMFDALKSQQHNNVQDGIKLVDIPKAKLVFEDNRLLVYSFIPTFDSFNEMTTEVFLELSVSRRCLGRVYIKLCNDKDMAELFLSKCLGTLSASFPWTSLSMLSNSSKSIQCLAFSHQIKRSVPDWYKASSEGQDMGTDTESKIEGTVAVLETESKVYQFCILIKCASKVRRESFGRVSSGLKVVLDAIRQDPKSLITITNCGLVVDDFSAQGL